MTLTTMIAASLLFNLAGSTGDDRKDRKVEPETEERAEKEKKEVDRKEAEKREEKRRSSCRRNPVTQRCSFGATPFLTS